ncbi:ABC-three component system middle component 1 [Paracoccus nototheniae]|uniref:ABC-three component system middle component 1 n=1 Tax=Paracoccus nototheniae TaxID=2489002 RepID=A0ABW4DZV9_9RHOB|nr:ABC-three component system middle component 1 [Paracoccus nototheniae]
MTQREPPPLMLLLTEAAQSIGTVVTKAPEQLSGSRFNSEVLSEPIAGSTIGRRDSDLPRHVAAATLDGIPVLFGMLDGSALKRSIDQQMRRYRNQATIARSWLGSDAPNLQLFVSAPSGALRDPAWRQLAAEIEADDRTCRKLVWLFEGSPTLDDAKGFLERTFIARPWPAEQVMQQLDSMANISLPIGWEEAIEDPDLDFSGLVERLIELERGAPT